MIDPDLNKQLDAINGTLLEIKKKTGSSHWRAFLNGTLSGLGSIIGVAIALVVIGYILNAIGVIPVFRGEVTRINQVLDQFQKTK
jgi:hypothetical protein